MDVRRLKSRSITAIICYSVTALMFAVALLLGGAAATIALVDLWGLIPGLLVAAAIFSVIGIAALLVNAMLRRRYRRMRRYASTARATVLASAAAAGATRGSRATPFLLPVAGLIAFVVARSMMGGSRDDDD